MKCALLFVALLLVACTPTPEDPSPNARAMPSARVATSAAPTLIDIRVEFETGLDQDYGEGATSVRAFLVVPALSVRQKLFAVPYPYQCMRRETDAGNALGVECRGDDGNGWASITTAPDRILVVTHDYGRLDLMQGHSEIQLPAGSTATLFAPTKYP